MHLAIMYHVQFPLKLIHGIVLLTKFDCYYLQYLELQGHFSNIHKELKDLQKQGHGTSEVKSDIKTMEEEKENLMRVIDLSIYDLQC